jgi:hypothetical protein
LATLGFVSQRRSGRGESAGVFFPEADGVDIDLSPEMKSTGEVMGVDNQFPRALYKAMIASGFDIPLPQQKNARGEAIGHSALLTTLANHNKEEGAPIIKGFYDMGYKIYATEGTSRVLKEHGVECEVVRKIREEEPNLMTVLTTPDVDFLINTPERERSTEKDGLRIRRAAVEHGVPCLTSLDTAAALLTALRYQQQERVVGVRAVGEYAVPNRNSKHCRKGNQSCNLLNIVFTGKDQVETRVETLAQLQPNEVLVEAQRSLISTGTEGIILGRKFESGSHWDKLGSISVPARLLHDRASTRSGCRRARLESGRPHCSAG